MKAPSFSETNEATDGEGELLDSARGRLPDELFPPCGHPKPGSPETPEAMSCMARTPSLTSKTGSGFHTPLNGTKNIRHPEIDLAEGLSTNPSIKPRFPGTFSRVFDASRSLSPALSESCSPFFLSSTECCGSFGNQIRSSRRPADPQSKNAETIGTEAIRPQEAIVTETLRGGQEAAPERKSRILPKAFISFYRSCRYLQAEEADQRRTPRRRKSGRGSPPHPAPAHGSCASRATAV